MNGNALSPYELLVHQFSLWIDNIFTLHRVTSTLITYYGADNNGREILTHQLYK